MTDRVFWRGVAIGAVFTASIAVGALQLHEAQDLALSDRRADSLQARLDTAAMKSAADSIEKARLGATADSSSAAARRVLAARPRATFTVAPDTLRPATEGDTVRRALIMRAIDPVPFTVPQFLIDQLQEQEEKLGFAVRAWQDSERARLFADTVYIPDLRRQLHESGELIRAERLRVDERDARIAKQERELAMRRRFGFKEGAGLGALLATLVLLGR